MGVREGGGAHGHGERCHATCAPSDTCTSVLHLVSIPAGTRILDPTASDTRIQHPATVMLMSCPGDECRHGCSSWPQSMRGKSTSRTSSRLVAIAQRGFA